jgi:anti-sigma regulatory factor (Ser/Thr protein kinase)
LKAAAARNWVSENMLTARPPLELRLDARPEVAATLRERLSDWLEAAGVTRKDVFEVTLATTEAFENAVRHPGRPRAPSVDLKVSITDSSLSVSLRDHGVWDGQAGEADGLGLPMMRLLMDGVEVQTRADGTTVTMWRALSLH